MAKLPSNPETGTVLKKKPPLLLTLGAALLFVGGGALAFWFTSRRGPLSEALPQGADAIPQDALLVLSLSSDEAQWRRLRQFGSEATQEQFDQFLVEWRDRLLTDNNLNFSQDVKPWVGPEITLAVLPDAVSPTDQPLPIPTPESALTSNLVVVVPINNATQAKSRLGERLEEAPDMEENPYRGVMIQKIEGANDSSLYAAVLNPETALLSPQLSLLKRSIDTFKGGSSLADKPEFRKAFEQLAGGTALGRFYVNVPAAVQAVSNASEPPLPMNRLEALLTPRGLAGVMEIETRGVHLQSISWLEEESKSFPTGNPADQMPQRLPADTLLMVSGGNFQKFWEAFKTGDQLSALLPFQGNELEAGLQSATGLSLDEDFLPWMSGEFGVSILTPPETAPAAATDEAGPEAAPPLPNPALALMVETSDREAATETFAQLGEVLTTRYRFAESSEEISGVEVTTWTSPFDSLAFSYGWLEGDIAFLTVGQGVTGLLVPTPGRSLAESSLFQLTTGSAPRPNNGHFFVSLTDISKAQDSLLLPPLPEDGLINSEVIEAVGVTATVLTNRQVQYDITAALRRGERPAPLPEPTITPTPAASPTPEAEETPAEAETDTPAQEEAAPAAGE
jgi:hypothetical protein